MIQPMIEEYLRDQPEDVKKLALCVIGEVQRDYRNRLAHGGRLISAYLWGGFASTAPAKKENGGLVSHVFHKRLRVLRNLAEFCLMPYLTMDGC